MTRDFSENGENYKRYAKMMPRLSEKFIRMLGNGAFRKLLEEIT